MDTAANKAIALRYFSEMVDKRSDRLIEELWTEDCVVHRPEVSATIRGREAFRQAFNRVVGPYSEFKTTIHDLVAENDLVVCHLSHRSAPRRKLDEPTWRPCGGRRQSSHLVVAYNVPHSRRKNH